MNTEMIKMMLFSFEEDLKGNELKESTLEKYRHDMERFMIFTGENLIDRETTVSYREMLLLCYKPATAISYLMTVNRFFIWAGMGEYCAKLPKLQKRYSLDRTIDEEDYHHLLSYAGSHGKWKYYCIMRTLAGTGIRVGELCFVTCENVEKKSALISKKNKIREVYFTDELCRILKKYAGYEGIQRGCLFVGRNREKPMNNSAVWKALKRLASKCGVEPEKVYPHSFRHLFARTYMKKIGNLTELADILGHSSLETTRIYTMGTDEEKRSSLAVLGL